MIDGNLRPVVRIVYDLGYRMHVYVNGIRMPGNLAIDFHRLYNHRNDTLDVQLTFRNAVVEIQHVDPDATLANFGRPELADGLPKLPPP